jgi:hypothetical protein
VPIITAADVAAAADHDKTVQPQQTVRGTAEADLRPSPAGGGGGKPPRLP